MKASWDDDFPIYGQIKFMFQTTNQVYIVYNLNIVAIIENQRCPPFMMCGLFSGLVSRLPPMMLLVGCCLKWSCTFWATHSRRSLGIPKEWKDCMSKQNTPERSSFSSTTNDHRHFGIPKKSQIPKNPWSILDILHFFKSWSVDIHQNRKLPVLSWPVDHLSLSILIITINPYKP